MTKINYFIPVSNDHSSTVSAFLDEFFYYGSSRYEVFYKTKDYSTLQLKETCREQSWKEIAVKIALIATGIIPFAAVVYRLWQIKEKFSYQNITIIPAEKSPIKDINPNTASSGNSIGSREEHQLGETLIDKSQEKSTPSSQELTDSASNDVKSSLNSEPVQIEKKVTVTYVESIRKTSESSTTVEQESKDPKPSAFNVVEREEKVRLGSGHKDSANSVSTINGQKKVAVYVESIRRIREDLITIPQEIVNQLESQDEKMQQEGVDYFKRLIQNSFHPILPEKELSLAIDVAGKLFMNGTKDSTSWISGYHFFQELIQRGKEDDVLKIKAAILLACSPTSPQYYMAYKLCDVIITTHHLRKDLLAIPLEAAKLGISSDNSHLRDQGFHILWRFLSWAPEYSIQTTLDCILEESKRDKIAISMLSRLQEIVDQDTSNHLCEFKKTLETHWQECVPTLKQALTNISNNSCSYTREQAAGMMQRLDQRLNAK